MIKSILLRKIFFFFVYFGFVLNKATTKSKISSFYKKLKVKKFDLIILGQPHHDGSYCIPDALKDVKHCISFGIGNNIDFELDLAKKKIHSTCFDGTVNNLPLSNSYINFVKKNVMPKSSFLNSLFPEDNKNFRSIDINTSIGSIFKKYNDNDEFILKMDIEGHEYKNILDISEQLLDKFKILVIEFHFMNLIIKKDNFNVLNQCFQKLLKNFYIVYIQQGYDNNYIQKIKGNYLFTTLEISFLRKDCFYTVEDCEKLINLNWRKDKKVPNKLIYNVNF